MNQPMTLHWSPRSPYVRKVMIAVSEMGLQDRIRTIRTVTGGTTPHQELMKINPLGKIPTLELTDGGVLYDSPVIIEYLDTLHDGPKLFPAAAPARGVPTSGAPERAAQGALAGQARGERRRAGNRSRSLGGR